jgi:hypothetical protein
MLFVWTASFAFAMAEVVFNEARTVLTGKLRLSLPYFFKLEAEDAQPVMRGHHVRRIDGCRLVLHLED